MCGSVGFGFIDQIGDVLNKGRVKRTKNRRACIQRLMNVDEAEKVCQERSKWRSTIFAFSYLGNRREIMC